MIAASRALVTVSLAVIGLACGCASDGGAARDKLPPVLSPPQSPVRYSEIRPDDLVPSVYRGRAGDVLQLSLRDLVAPGVETVKVMRVSQLGTISLPLVGPVHVAGLTEEELNEAVRRAMSHLCF